MKFLRSYISFIDKMSRYIGTFVSWLTLLLVLVTCYDVFMRYFLKEGSAALQELEWHLFAVIFLAGASYTLMTEGHVRVDVFYSRFSEKKKAVLNLSGTILFLIPFCIMVILSSENFVLTSFRISESSPDAGGLPARYLLKALIPVSFFLLLLQGLSLAFKSILVLKSAEDNI